MDPNSRILMMGSYNEPAPFGSLDVSPDISYTNNSILAGSSNQIWVWNGGKGLLVTSPSILTAGSANSQSLTATGFGTVNSTSYVIPQGLWWVYAVVIGAGGGGSSDYPPRPGGGGGGAAFAKIDLRSRVGQTMSITSGAGGAVQNASGGGTSSLVIDGAPFLTATGGGGGKYSWGAPGQASGGPGGTGTVGSSSNIIYSFTQSGGRGGGNFGTAENGFPGATGGGGCSNGTATDDGGASQFFFCGGGAGGDSSAGNGGNHSISSYSVLLDSARSVYPVANSTKEFSLVSGLPFFGDASSSTAFDGKNGSTSSTNTEAGFFGSGGGGSGSGSGSRGGPGAVILWWN